MIFRRGNHPNIPHMANVSSSAQVICWLLSHFVCDISCIPFLTPCPIRIGISRIDYPHTIPCRKHHLANSQNGWSAIKLYLLKPATETAMEFITSQSWLSGFVSPLFCVAARFTDQPSCYTPQSLKEILTIWKIPGKDSYNDHFLGNSTFSIP